MWLRVRTPPAEALRPSQADCEERLQKQSGRASKSTTSCVRGGGWSHWLEEWAASPRGPASDAVVAWNQEEQGEHDGDGPEDRWLRAAAVPALKRKYETDTDQPGFRGD